ncbi:hypothetical protein [Bradyrhizobium sp. CW11]|uniref:hypothetical protein n=1 Tax=Bradyrhizobium sp. CW11 TaxID=2782684 RepID=UPI001FF78804|nr:hypothetical protein [Bradyrhizobium sp. CW11]MCK1346830.1 hypothetical protein [Bradyrhizobium sp. CW11]
MRSREAADAPICHEGPVHRSQSQPRRAERIDWERTILIVSTAVTVGLGALYVFGKSTSRW